MPCVDEGQDFGPWAPVFSTWSLISQDTVQSQENQAKTIVTNGTRGDSIYSGAFRVISKYAMGRFIFKPQSKTKALRVMSASLLSVPELLSVSFSKNHSDSGFGLSLKEWSESRLHRNFLLCVSAPET